MEDPGENTTAELSKEGLERMSHLLENLCVSSGADDSDLEVLRSRIDEQSSLISILKQRSDDLLLHCQALHKLNTELEDKVTDCQAELDKERDKYKILEDRFMTLASNHQAIIVFKDEYKCQNTDLKQRNQELQSENEALFSKKLQDQESTIQSLSQEIKKLKETFAQAEKDYSKTIARLKERNVQQDQDREAQQASLVDKLQSEEKRYRNTRAMCNDLKVQLKNTQERGKSKEAAMTKSIESLTTERDTFLQLSVERGKLLQEKQQELEQMEKKMKEEKTSISRAEERLKKEMDAVNADARVMSLQSALEESTSKHKELEKEYEAFKKHSANLLNQERELNNKLMLMTG